MKLRTQITCFESSGQRTGQTELPVAVELTVTRSDPMIATIGNVEAGEDSVEITERMTPRRSKVSQIYATNALCSSYFVSFGVSGLKSKQRKWAFGLSN